MSTAYMLDSDIVTQKRPKSWFELSKLSCRTATKHGVPRGIFNSRAKVHGGHCMAVEQPCTVQWPMEFSSESGFFLEQGCSCPVSHVVNEVSSSATHQSEFGPDCGHLPQDAVLSYTSELGRFPECEGMMPLMAVQPVSVRASHKRHDPGAGLPPPSTKR